ncbi:MAG: hypothetical protein LRS48_04755 [Desulfurococcales archaeon]|nr:hypothetical protein [Desulfurococcales archaeon]
MRDVFEGLEIIVDCCGSIVKAKRTKKSFLVCPICGEAIFFTEEDLLYHLVAHARNTVSKTHRLPRR